MRQIQVLQVHKLLIDGDATSIADACAIVGIHERTYRRWKDTGLAALQEQIDEQSQMIGQQLLDAQPSVVAELLERLLGDEEQKAAVQYWPAYYDRFQQLLERTLPEASPESGDERAFLESDRPWLEGPSTTHVSLPDGTQVTVTRPGQQHLEGAFAVVPDDAPPPPTSGLLPAENDTSEPTP